MDQPKRPLNVSLKDIAEAMDNSSAEARYYLDLETGQIILITEDDYEYLREAQQDHKDPAGKIDWAAAQTELDLDDEQVETLQVAEVVDRGETPRYRAITSRTPRAGYNDMTDFIAALNNPRLQVRLDNAIKGRGAFRAFKEALAAFPKERQQWFQFRDQRTLQRAREWLEAENIEPVE